jgi:hypothetical protein
MSLNLRLSTSFALLMSASIGLGACAAHKRDGVAAVRATRDAKTQQAKQDALDAANTTDLRSLISPTNKGTYQLTAYHMKIVRNNDEKSPVAEVLLASSPLISDGKLPVALKKNLVTVKVTDKDTEITQVLSQLSPLVNEFSAADGSIISMRQDTVALKDKSKGEFQEDLSITAGSGTISESTFSPAKVLVKKVSASTVEIGRASVSSSGSVQMREVLTYELKPAQVMAVKVHVASDAKAKAKTK